MSELDANRPAIILASGSPRRRELVERIGFEPRVRVSDIPEQIGPDESPRNYTRRLAREKAEDVASQIADEPDADDWPRLVLAADTIVIHDDQILEKPADDQEAFEMLRSMAGGAHTVQTSFCWHDRRDDDPPYHATLDTTVRMREVTDEFIRRYVETGEPRDKAGAYGIQDVGSLLVDELEGSYFNVVGLPVSQVVEALEQSGWLEAHPLLGTT
jgi:septum formation protein